jgi:two-component SAPR family response regulator
MYFITTIEKTENLFDSFQNQRTVGFFENLDRAVDIVKNNRCDINETIYDYAVIEYLTDGLYPVAELVELYKFDHDKNEYFPCKDIDIPVFSSWVNIG